MTTLTRPAAVSMCTPTASVSFAVRFVASISGALVPLSQHLLVELIGKLVSVPRVQWLFSFYFQHHVHIIGRLSVIVVILGECSCVFLRQ